jgi:hypothetical protein
MQSVPLRGCVQIVAKLAPNPPLRPSRVLQSINILELIARLLAGSCHRSCGIFHPGEKCQPISPHSLHGSRFEHRLLRQPLVVAIVGPQARAHGPGRLFPQACAISPCGLRLRQI